LEQVIFLGTSSAISNEKQENSHLFFQSGNRKILVDCPGNPISRMKELKINPLELTDLIITHFHPDHVSGLPLLLMDLWIMGRKDPLSIFGLQFTLDRAKAMMDLFDWQKWPEFFSVNFSEVEETNNFPIIISKEINVFTAPGKHLIPSIGVKFEFPVSGKKIAYSSDTEPCESMMELIKNTDILIHESGGSGFGHTSAENCGKIALEAAVKQLYLIHYPGEISENELLSQASKFYFGDVFLAKDLLTIKLA